MKQPPVSRRQRESSADATEPRVLSYKELAKEKRHAMYQLAKARRATDPRYLSMLEALKLQRRAAYQKVMDRRKAEAAEAKAKVKAKRRDGIAIPRLTFWVPGGSRGFPGRDLADPQA